MMIQYFELDGTLFRRLDTGFDLFAERLDPDSGEWVDDPATIRFLAGGAPGAVRVDVARAAEVAAALGAALEPPAERDHTLAR